MRLALWDYKGPTGKAININLIDPFDARGLRRLYERKDSFPGHSFNMTIWKDQKNRLFARFWCRSKYIDWESYEIIGIKMKSIIRCQEKAPDPKSAYSGDYNEKWIPECLKDAYDDWIVYADW